MSLCSVVVMCHAPVVIPAIGGERAHDCLVTTRAMREAAAALVAHEPQLLVVVSPHAPRQARSFGVTSDAGLAGDFERFGQRQLALSFPGAPAAAAALADAARAQRVLTHALDGSDLDHGAMVPLWFVHEAGYRGPVLVISLPYPGRGLELPFGRALCHAARDAGQRWALLASGDMSHRLSPGAPAGFDPRAAVFDQSFRAAMEQGNLRAAATIASDLAELAAEDILQSSTIAGAAIDFSPRGQRVLAYEAPFGVGYLEAILYSDRAGRVVQPPHPLVAIARDAIQHALREEAYTPPDTAGALATRAVFVTLRAPDGTLRGCVGRTEPRHESLAQEVADCAVGAAMRDVRVPPLAPHELSALAIEVSLLSPPEVVSSPSQLDAQRYGVIVSHGARRGVLLPDVPGIRTVEDQLRIALHKAGISPVDAYQIERFTTEKLGGTPS